MKTKLKRIFNYRPMCFFAMCLALGIILGEAVFGEHIALIICMCVLSFATFLTLTIIPKTRKYFYLPLALLIGLVSITSSNAIHTANLLCEEQRGTITATVVSEVIVEGDEEEGTTRFFVSDISLDGKRLKYDGAVYVFSAIEPNFNAGDSVKITGTIQSNEKEKFDSAYASQVSTGKMYRVFAYNVEKVAERKPKFPLSLQMKIKSVLSNNLDDYTASVCKALILGDRSSMEESDYENIRRSGLAHVLAVSGMHITLISSVLYFILKKMKINPKICFAVVTVMTFIYSMLCSFTASSLRAFIMTAVFSFASSFGFKRDGLSALSLAATLILTFRPTAQFEVGFLLSFFAMLGLMLLYRPFRRAGMAVVNKVSPKKQIGKRFVEVCATSFAVNIMTLPMVAHFFGEVPTLYILSNFLILPYLLAIYVLSMALTLLSLVTTFGGFVVPIKYLMIPFKYYVHFIGGLHFATVPMPSSVVAIIFHAVIMLFLSGFFFTKRRRTKVIGASVGYTLMAGLWALFLII